MASNGIMVCARDLAISWENDSRYWRWCQEGSSYVAQLIEVFWLEVKGTFDTSRLACNTSYKVSFVVKLRCNASGWNNPVQISLCAPNGNTQQNTVYMCNQPKEQWIEIPAGSFRTYSQNCGQIQFSFREVSNYAKKTGLVIKGVRVQPLIETTGPGGRGGGHGGGGGRGQGGRCCQRQRCCQRCCQRQICCRRQVCCYSVVNCCCQRVICCPRKVCCRGYY